MVSIEDAALAQSCVSPKTVEINFQLRIEEKVENELEVVSMESVALAKPCALQKIVDQNVLKLVSWFFKIGTGLFR